ncbi:MAG: 23S rRNA (uracil(1939)-C(5))-methyltransferase RlmD [Nitrospirae bacterium]|nr:23S rRNA (uracil(1939)-C(5))-methyltransferase RlmD [Nitrospirota bacterium]MBI3352994.1 23S rRNA (uracil(1939)-C(5))-methyltransferase RlmD [Nitrospirota bacterium]
MRTGENRQVKIEKLVAKGKGLARLEDKIVFVPYVIPEETAEIKITGIKKDYLLANKVAILDPSSFRVTPLCPVFEQCGGCQWQMIDYPNQMSLKVDLLKESLHRIGKIDPEILFPVPSPHPFHYRQRVRFQTSYQSGKMIIGFFRPESKEIVPVQHCFIINPLLNSLLEKVSLHLNDSPDLFQTLKEMSFSLADPSDEILIEMKMKEFPKNEAIMKGFLDLPFKIRGVVITREDNNQKVFGESRFFHLLKNPLNSQEIFKIRNSAGVFSQVNREVNLKLMETLFSWAQFSGKERALELHSGQGNFTLLLAKSSHHLTAVEENPLAIEDLKYNLQINQISNCSVRKEKSQAVLKRWDKIKFPLDILILDPPREGIDGSTIDSILRIGPGRMYYISCDPATLARDLKVLSKSYSVGRVAPFDMFPQTAHIETLTELRLKA